MTFQPPGKRRSVSLTKEEHRAFVKYYHSFPTKVDAEVAIGIRRQVMDLVAIKGSGHSDTIAVIREKLNQIDPKSAA